MRQPVLLLLAGGLAVAPPTAISAAQTELTGQTAGGAHYRIAVPDGWAPNDGLVIWNHGFTLDPIGPVEDLGPLVDVQLSQGYAVAASSYSQRGWALYRSLRDTKNLIKAFRRRVGDPGMIIVSGQGMGGLIADQIVTKGKIPEVVGALHLAGMLAGSTSVWEEALDMRLMYDFICGNVPEGQIPGGADGLPEKIPRGFDLAELARRVDACLGTNTPLEDRNAQQVFWLDFLQDLTRGSPGDVQDRIMYGTFGLHDLVFDRKKQNGRRGVGNLKATYPDFFIDVNIARVPAGGRAGRLRKNYTPTGKVGDVKIVSIHTDKDGLVLVENQSEYAAVVPPDNLTLGVLVEDTPSHAGFTEAETLAAWEVLRGWVAGSPQQTAQDLQDTCNAIVLERLAAGPCRIDPAFQNRPYTGFREQR